MNRHKWVVFFVCSAVFLGLIAQLTPANGESSLFLNFEEEGRFRKSENFKSSVNFPFNQSSKNTCSWLPEKPLCYRQNLIIIAAAESLKLTLAFPPKLFNHSPPREAALC